MPQGVQHMMIGGALGGVLQVARAVMPQGVQHSNLDLLKQMVQEVARAVMPQGVQHRSAVPDAVNVPGGPRSDAARRSAQNVTSRYPRYPEWPAQ